MFTKKVFTMDTMLNIVDNRIKRLVTKWGTLMKMIRDVQKDLKDALDTTSIVAITDAQGTITYVNNQFCEISKYSKEELLGSNHRILNSNYHSKSFFKQMYQTIRSGSVWKGEIRNKTKDGQFYWVDTTIVPSLDEEGNPYQYVSIRVDITSRKMTEQELQRTLNDLAVSNKEIEAIKHALDASSILAITNQKGAITYVNDTFCEISKYTREELIGQDHRILNSGFHTKAFFKEMAKTIGKGGIWKGEIKNRAKDGTYYWVDTTIVPFLNEVNKPYQYVAIRKDISDRKRAEEIVINAEKLAAVGQMAAGVAHEIKNPLTSLKGYTEYLRDDTKDEEKTKLFDILLEEIERINVIVGEFMILGKPDTCDFQMTDLISTLKHITFFLQSEAKKKNVEFVFDFEVEDAYINGEESQLKQVFLNILKNGIEAMPHGGDIVIKLVVQDKEIEMSFKDSGVGISQDKLASIGQPFYTTKQNGNGLGLMVTKKIIQNHLGNMTIDSVENQGTTIFIQFPRW